MIYAVADLLGGWTILKGWEGCNAGQGEVLKFKVGDEELEKILEMCREDEEEIMKTTSTNSDPTKYQFTIKGIGTELECKIILEKMFDSLKDVE